MRIVFMGTPEFAVPTLDTLIHSPHSVVSVITATDKYGGRGKKQLLQSAVKKHALTHNIPVIQPTNLKSNDFVEHLRQLHADLFVVVAFRMLPKVVWSIPPKGTINLHGSLLPTYRGAAPINWAIINGDTLTGLTTFFIDKKIDTGEMILQEEVQILETDTAGTLHDRMMDLGADLVLRTVNQIEKNEHSTTMQDQSKVSNAPKLYHEDCEIQWNWDVRYAYNFTRGLSPYPGAWLIWNNQKVKILRTHLPVKHQSDDESQTHIQINKEKGYFRLRFHDGTLDVTELKIEGKRMMKIQDFLNGLRSSNQS